jgi:thiamine-phosphate pyrophosphorylase
LAPANSTRYDNRNSWAMNKLQKGLYVITEDQLLNFDEVYTRTEEILCCHISVLQYRKKNAPYEQKKDEALALKKLCNKFNTPFIINDDLDLAVEIDSDGIHLGEDDVSCKQARSLLGENKIIGISCYNDPDSAELAYNESADYLAFGAMYKTTTKQRTRQASLELLVRAKQRFPVPLVAIGGITPENCRPVLEAGADLLAVVSCVYHAEQPCEVISNFNTHFIDYYESI